MATDRMIRLWAFLLLGLFGAGVQAMEPIQHWVTANGARVYFVPAPEIPMVDLRVVFDAGSARDGGKAGLARMTAALLDQGAGGRSADEIAAAFDAVGARLDIGSLRDMAWVGLRTLTDAKAFEPALATWIDVLTRPDFNERDFERERERRLVGLEHDRQRPARIAEKAYYRALYRDHPYASPPGGTVESIKALTRDDLRAFHRRYYVARNAVVAIVGDLDRAAAEALAERMVEGLPAGEPAPALPPVPPLEAAKVEVIDHPSTQTHILMGQPGMARKDPDYFRLYVGNYILGGGGLVSRLNQEVREQRGLSYSVYSYFSPMQVAGPFTLGLQTRNDQAAEALAVVRETLGKFLDEGPTRKEMEAAIKHITGGHALRIDSNGKILEYLGVIGFYGLPLDYLETFNEKIEAVTLEEVVDAFRRRVHPERMVTVQVGRNGAAAEGGR